MKTIDIEVHYTVRLDTKEFARLLAHAKEQGCDYHDAGPVETIRRFLTWEGFDTLEEITHVTTHTIITHPVKVEV